MKILITGGAGYVGTILSQELLKSNYKITVLDSLIHRNHNVLDLCNNNNFDFIKGDVRNENTMKDIVPKHDIIIHLAAIVGAPACNQHQQDAIDTNYKSTEWINANKSKNQILIFPNTDSSYGEQPNQICDEKTPLNPLSLYSETKTKSEELLLASNNNIVLRLATVFGLSPRLRTDLLINDFTYKSYKHRYLVIFEKDFQRNFIHVRDLAKGFKFCVEHSEQMLNQVFNVGNDDLNMSKAEIAYKIKEQIPDTFLHFADFGTDLDKRNYRVLNEKIKKMGFSPTIDINTGIKELIKGYSTLKSDEYQNF